MQIRSWVAGVRQGDNWKGLASWDQAYPTTESNNPDNINAIVQNAPVILAAIIKHEDGPMTGLLIHQLVSSYDISRVENYIIQNQLHYRVFFTENCTSIGQAVAILGLHGITD